MPVRLIGGLPLAAFCAVAVWSQVAGLPTATDLQTLSPQQLRAQQDAQLRGEQVPADNAVDARQYRIGPGDVLVIQRLDALAQEEYAVVTPENMVAVPRIGMISVAGLTMAEVRDTITALYRQRTPTVPVYVGLRRSRLVYVTVQGNVLFPGVFAVPASMRVMTLLRLAMQGTPQQNAQPPVQQAIQQAFGQLGMLPREEQLLKSRQEFLPPTSLRSILIRHADGSTTLVDGERALAEPSSEANPYLREGDVVIVPPAETNYPRIAIDGAVARPRVTAFRPGDRLSFLLKLGGSLLPESGNIWLIQGGQRIPVRADSALRLLSEDYVLEPGAVVYVERRAQPQQTTGTVRIVGEVERPGVYPITPSKTRLRDVISEAGGFTERASLALAYIVRREVNAPEQRLLQNPAEERLRRFKSSNLLVEDTLRYFIDELTRLPVVACDFRACFERGSEQDNVVLVDGDLIVVPPKENSVYVYGQVKKPGFVHFEPQKDAEYYIAQAGGRTDLADRGRERVIKARTGVWVPLDEATVEPGDRIYVPHPPDEPIGMSLQRLSAYIGIAGGLAGLVFSLVSLVNFLRNR